LGKVEGVINMVVAVGVIIALGNVVKNQYPKVVGLYGVLLSVVLGLIAGYFNLLDVVGLEQGLYAGLMASGVYTVAKRIGSQ
jgi:uncharacterized membrane protein